MNLKKTPELQAFLSTYFADADADAPGGDEQVVKAFLGASTPERQRQVVAQLKLQLADGEMPLEEIGLEANRWLGDAEEAKAWFSRLLAALEAGQGSGAAESVVVRDSNGAVLAEGDSVQVIKDLKVKGGSSDLKRGTIIKKIHLIDDAENIECRVDGSTLVLKTMFLVKR